MFYAYWDQTRDSKLCRVTAPSANPCPGLAPTTGVRAIEYDYDANGNLIQTTQIGSDATTTRTHFTSFDALNRPLQSIGATYTDATLGSIRPVTQTTYNLLGVLTIYFSRFGYLYVVPRSELVDSITFRKFVQWFQKRTAEAFPSAGTRASSTITPS